jgi:hypothetical protein
MVGHPCMKRHHHVHPPHYLTLTILLLGSNLIHPLAGHAPPTSPQFTSHHACPLVSARHASKDRPNPDPPPALTQRAGHVPSVCTASLLHQHRM